LRVLAHPALDHIGDRLHGAAHIDAAFRVAHWLHFVADLGAESVARQADHTSAVDRAFDLPGRPGVYPASPRAAACPGRAGAACGIATTFATTPIGATVPKANAVTGAVTSVAAAVGATSRSARGERAIARSAQITAPIAATESQAPTACSAHGSASSTTRAESAITPRGAATRWRSRAT